jgi:hypothetical protein
MLMHAQVRALLHSASLAVMRIPWRLFVFVFSRIGEPFVQGATQIYAHGRENGGLFARTAVCLPIYAAHNSRPASRTHAAGVLFTSGKSGKGALHVFEPVVSLSAAARICIKCAQANFRVHALNDSMQMLALEVLEQETAI